MMLDFIHKKDQSLALAGSLEAAVDMEFPEDGDWQELVLALASYRPGGGEYLYAEYDITRLCERLIHRLSDGR